MFSAQKRLMASGHTLYKVHVSTIMLVCRITLQSIKQKCKTISVNITDLFTALLTIKQYPKCTHILPLYVKCDLGLCTQMQKNRNVVNLLKNKCNCHTFAE